MLGIVTQSFNLSILEAETGGSHEFLADLVHRELQDSQGYIKLCLKFKNKNA